MKYPVVFASVVIAASIACSAVLLSYASATAEANRMNALFGFLEHAVQDKNAQGETRLQSLATGVAQSLSKGFQSGFNKPDDGDKKKTAEYEAEIAALPLNEVQLVPDDKYSEKCIGLVTNNTGKPIRDIQLNVIYRDKDGKLLDVSSSFARIDGTLLTGKQFGFSIDHRLGSGNTPDAELAAKKAASVTVSIASFQDKF